MTDLKKVRDGEAHPLKFATPDGSDDRDQLATTLRRNNEKLELLAEISGLLLYNEKPNEIIKTIAAKVMDYLDYDVLFNYIIDEKAGRLKLNAYAGVPSKVARDVEWLEFGVAVCGVVARDGVRIIAENIPENDAEMLNSFRPLAILSYACHPLKWSGQIIGTLGFGSRFRKSFNPEELDMMKIVADQISVALYRQRSEDDLRVKQKEFYLDNEELRAGQLELSSLNEKLTAQSEEINKAFLELQRKSVIIEEYAETVSRMCDISEQRATELNIVISSIAAGIIIYDNTGLIVRINEFARKLLGYNVDDLQRSILDRSIKLNVCKTDGTPFQFVELPLVRALKGEVIQNEEMMIKESSHRQICISATAAPIRDNGQINGVVFVFTDSTERRRENHQKITNILESITDCFYALDHDWRFTYLNKEFVKFSGQKREDLLGRVIWEVYPQMVGDSTFDYFHRAVAEETPLVFESGYDELNHWYEYHIYPGKEGLSVYFRDITEKKQSEKVTQRLAAIVENSEDAIISINPNGVVTSWNHGAEKLYGYSASEMIGESILKIAPSETHDWIKKESHLFIQNLPFEDNNLVQVCKDGTLVNVSVKSSVVRDSRGHVIEISSIHRNESDRVKFIDGLTKERELLMVTLNSLDEAVVATDRDERIFLINEAALNLTGYSRFEATDEPMSKILYVLNDKTSEPILDFSSMNASALPVLVTRSLTEIPISIHRSPIKNRDGQIIGAVTVFQDISEKQKVVQKLIEQDKLESLGILAGGIAHDFNNVLAAILSNIQLAMLKLKKNEDIKPYLLKTIETTHRASDLTKQLLTFSKGGAPVKKDASLVDLIRDTAEFVLRGSKIKAIFGVPDNLWPANVDTGQISQVIQNLVINAKQAMPKGGVLKIFAENLYFDERSFYKPGNYIRISVQDQGSGIPKEILSKIFDPYFTTKKEGNGLGLATSYSIITQHDGYLEVESTEGVGSIFHIYLPASNAVIALQESRKESAATSASGYKILLMDDEEIILNAISEILECYGHHVVAVKDGVLAVEEYKQALSYGEPFDVVIMDLTIPGGMGGQEAVAHLRDLDPKVKAIVSSGYANDPIMSDFERYGFAGVVNKPYKINELNQVLHRVLNTEQLTLMLTY